MYTDDTILTWGKYKFTALKRIPASWLLSKHKSKGIHDKELVEYVALNFDRLKEREAKKEVAAPVELPCSKFIYITEKEAKSHLQRIRETSEGHHKIPIRAYECEKCGAWHLTSQTVEQNFEKRQKVL